MNYYETNRTAERKDKVKSAIITAIIWSALLLFVFLYTVKQYFPKEKEVVNTMLVNFGDNRNGKGIEEPANQEGSLASKPETVETPVETPTVQPEPIVKKEPKPETKKAEPKDKIITGNNHKISTPKETSKTDKSKAATSASAKEKSAKSSATTANSTTGNGDGKGNAALGNFMKGRGSKPGSQGTGTGVGNAGDPLGGDGDGDSKIGVDRRLTGYIPGTMGRGGAQPSQSCTASGSITLAYTVDKAGNVISVRRSGGSSDPCIVSTSIQWVKKYVKAERANFSSTGTYKITF